MFDDHFDRRAFLRQVLVGVGALNLPNVLRLRAEAPVEFARKNTKLILLWQDGGPTHHETFDPKPDAPLEYRGELGAIPTTLAGVRFCEVLPRLAKLAHRFSVIRSIHQPSSGHVDGTLNWITGYEGNSRPVFPDLCSVAHRMRSEGASDERTALPQYIALGGQASIGLHRGGPAYLGPQHAPFKISADPFHPDFQVQNLQVADSGFRFRRRSKFLDKLDRFRGERLLESLDYSRRMSAMDRYYAQALDILTGSGEAARAFDLSREPRQMRERYGLNTAGQQALLSRRLVESGVSVVAVRFSPDGRGDGDRSGIGWDDHAVHGNIFSVMKRRGPQFDQAVSALIEDLGDRGLDEEVLVVLAGEFGRTPKIHVHKGCPGREHWGAAGNVLVYGGGLEMGQIIGATDSKGTQPSDRALKPQDVLATVYQVLGVDPHHEFLDAQGRPFKVLPTGAPIPELMV